ncbi:MarR family winged helix-turn-helix transcriptional regulator [Subtercola boreus]|uniref:MarR family winged helix-turn-helix transcriptional regulator n=1 Tax=Subtercola boreus TaxID=120213 RepID=UPI001C0EEEBF|nr:MarR family winged helix-turn-helix transcriptional regulator [Subtercola boreus]
MSRQAAAKTIGALERAGYVERTADAADARRKRLVVSGRGREAIAIGAAEFEKSYQRWPHTVGPATAASTLSALSVLSGSTPS